MSNQSNNNDAQARPCEAQEPNDQPEPATDIKPGAPVALVAAIAARKRDKLAARPQAAQTGQQPDNSTN